MIPERDEVMIAVALHELDFITTVRAARLLGTTRENIIKQAVANYLMQLQRQGLDLGIRLPSESSSEEKHESTSSEISRAGDASRHTKRGNSG